MNLKSVKTAADLPFKGVELVKVDSNVREVIVGGKLRIKANAYGTALELLVEQPFEAAKRYRVCAETDGFPPVVEYHEHSWDADSRVQFFKGKGAEASKEQVDVLINDAGEVAQVVTADAAAQVAAPATADADMPF